MNLPEEGQNNLWFEYNESETVFVFVHGILSDSRSAWLREASGDEDEVYWPNLVRSDDTFDQPSIFLGGYYTEPGSGSFGIRDAARDLHRRLNTVIEPAEEPVLAKKRILFIAHSTGGIVIRHMLVRHTADLSDKIVGLMLVASPSIGSRDATRLAWLADLVHSKMGAELQWDHPFLEELDKDFKNLVYGRSIPCLRGVEALENHLIPLPTPSRFAAWGAAISKWLGPLRREVLVGAESGGRYFGEPERLAATDHFSAAKPHGVGHPVHVLLRGFYSSDFDRPCINAEQVAEINRVLEEKLRRMEAEREQSLEREQFLRGQLRAQTEAVTALVSQKGQPDAPSALDQALEELSAGRTETARDLFGQLAVEKEAAGVEFLKQAAEAQRHLGALAFLDDTDAALAAYQRATELDPENPQGWNQLGNLEHRIGDLESAAAAFRAVLQLGRSNSSPGWQATAYGNLGNIYRTRGDLAQAVEMYEKALRLDQEMGRKEGMANAYGSLGEVYRIRGDLAQAVEMHEKALELDEELGRKEGIARNYGSLGSVHLTREDLGQAAEMYEKALRLSEEIGDKQGFATSYGNLGIVHQARGDLDLAIAMYRKALALNEELGHKRGMAGNYVNLGLVHELRKEPGQARDSWTRARNLYAEVGVPKKVEQMEDWLAKLEGSE